MVGRIKCVIESRVLRHDDKHYAGEAEIVNELKSEQCLFVSGLVKVDVLNILIERPQYHEHHGIDHEVADPYHPETESRCVASENISSPVEIQEQH